MTTSSTDSQEQRRGRSGVVAAGLLLMACAVACSLPMILGAGVVAGIGVAWMTWGIPAAGIAALLGAMVVWALRRRLSMSAGACACEDCRC